MEKITAPLTSYRREKRATDSIIDRHRFTKRVDEYKADVNDEKSLWRGDHSFSPDAASYSLTNFIEPEVKKDHPQWSVEEVKTEALKRFEKRLAQDLSYERSESAHEESSVTWTPVEIEPGKWELATTYGDKTVTLSELWDHTKEYAASVGNAAAYNAKEHEAQLLMQERFISGEVTGFVSFLSHPDSVRYVQVWKKNDEGNIESQHVDLYKATGRDFTPEEGEHLIAHIAAYHSASKKTENTEEAQYAHFFAVGHDIQVTDIKTIAIAQTMQEVREVSVVTLRTVRGREGGIIRDSVTVMTELALYVQSRMEKPAIRPEDEVPHQKSEYTLVPGLEGYSPRKKNGVGKMQGADGDATRMPDVGLESESVFVSVITDVLITRMAIKLAEAAPVAAIVWFSRFAPETLTPQTEVEMSLPLQIETKQPEKKSVFPRIPEFLFRIRSTVIDLFGLPGRPRTEDTNKAVPEKIETPLANRNGQQQDTLGKDEAEITSDHHLIFISTLLEQLRIVSGSVAPQEKVPMVDGALPEAAITKEKQRPVKRLTIALLVFWLLRAEEEINMAFSETEIITRKSPEREETPWLIFAIIWYLSMIREGGKSTSPQTPNPAQPIKQFPVSGIIYRYWFVVE